MLQAGVVLTTSAVVYITGAANTQTIIKAARFANVTAGVVTFTVYRLASGGSPLMVIPPRSIAANGTDLAPELSNMVLNAGDAVQCLASAISSVDFFASGWVAS